MQYAYIVIYVQKLVDSRMGRTASHAVTKIQQNNNTTTTTVWLAVIGRKGYLNQARWKMLFHCLEESKPRPLALDHVSITAYTPSLNPTWTEWLIYQILTVKKSFQLLNTMNAVLRSRCRSYWGARSRHTINLRCAKCYRQFRVA